MVATDFFSEPYFGRFFLRTGRKKVMGLDSGWDVSDGAKSIW